ncbi:MAG: phosphomannomutase [Candidatus Aegiribacteria sp.]|nr:phosphomannomutase [Candidatus Aegiribacteria sp.]MBD3294000.1 phosphomannomutase [Candidatus Fermentibacteria bacterium]
MNERVFRKYDIRGLFPRDLDRELTYKLGRALGRRAENTIGVGRDCRQSGGILVEWLSEGIFDSGTRVLDLGVQTTPMTYFAAHELGTDVTVMITGSHNPAEYNGFKIMYGLNTIHGNDIQQLRREMEDIRVPEEGSDKREPERISLKEQYINRLLGEFSFDRSLKVVVDGGNGTGGPAALETLENLGCRVIPLYCDMDGSFPNHHPDPTVPENLSDLKEKVLAERADLGIAFDGDADRLGIIDDLGRIVWGDRILIILARELLRTSPGATVISEVKASGLFFSEVEKAGGRPLMSPTGHSLIKKAMGEENALLAGEMSGHIFFRDRYYGYDDALYAALRLLEILASDSRPLHTYLEDLPEVFSTPEIRENIREEVKFPLVEETVRLLERDGFEVNTTDGARITFDDGWGLLRASNTQPVLVLRFEAGTKKSLADYEKTTRKYLNEAGRNVDV